MRLRQPLPLLAVGASLVVLLPSAHVALPSAGLAGLAPSARLRVISAGAFHNLVLWLALTSVSWLGFGTLVWSCLGYRDVSAYGRVVVAVEESSPVQVALPVGAVIVQIDDVLLASTKPPHDIWSLYASEGHKSLGADDLGWCMNSAWFLSQPEGCCDTNETTPNSSCFTADAVQSRPSVPRQKCAPTLEVLRPDLEVARRCAAAADCAEGNECVRLREDQHIMRVDFAPPGHDGGHQTMVWSGPPEEFFEDVVTSAYMPQYSFLPLWLPALFSTTFSYISTLTMSLYLFNLLPLPYLDGSQLLDALADLVIHGSSDRPSGDVELGETQRSASPGASKWRWRWYARMKQGTQLSLELLLVVCLLSALWRSWS
ncbi:uncharacterized protein PHACADRAFT_210853 [Phanerochaete carnosa HHB-10118-sp]|uniref:Endopeptidase S2P n=1 Tax=Phanerochaete carnosa (strain HHB-10118-sp) TaxID=650164 RepID=K5VNU4_PHACS|nr:uncharacterized protein PHACADRAFT_210853 [Phanerochaete carnosa HHB-10118-sp]EKM53148.1 hypothetical protein PHACADRAFT_210853 [Phanerochaete carnosa HHB-10118-sp]